MNSHRHRVPYERRVTSLKPRILPITIGVGIMFFFIVGFRLLLPTFSYRQGILLTGDPYEIASFSADRTHVTVAVIPPDTDIPAVFGYGRYAMTSLEKLDQIDRHNGTLLTQSTANAFGIPVYWYVIRKDALPKEPIDRLRTVFSWSSIIDALLHRTNSSLPAFTWISYVFAVQKLPADAVETVDMAKAVTPSTRPDGSMVSQLDESKLDYLFGQSFIDSGIRGEGHSVALYNTTSTPLVAQRASRVMAHMGIQLVFVGNASSDKKECRIHGTKEVLASKTARFIQSYFHCMSDGTPIDLGVGTGADMVVELGSTYADLYK